MNSAVWFATLNKFHSIGDFLIRQGVNVKQPVGRSSRCDNQATLLHMAAKSGKVHRVKLLLEHGADPNAKDSRKRSVLHYAVVRDRAAVVNHLITAGADMYSRDKHSMSVLHYAVMKKAENSIRILLQRGVDIEIVDSRGWNALHLAMLTMHVGIIEMLLNYGIGVNMKDVLYWTPLHFATFYTRSEKIVRMLLDHGAEINVKTKDGRFPLYYAVKERTPPVVKLLLSNGAKINETTEVEGETALHAACREDLASIADILLHNGADVNIRDKQGKVPLSTVKPDNGQITAKIVIKHIARMKADDAFINKGNMQEIRKNEELSRFYTRCHAELEIMKKTMVVEDYKASYFCILSKDLKTTAALVRNEKLVQAFQENNCWKGFAIYAADLKYKFNVAKAKSNALLSMEKFLSEIWDYRLPEPVVQKIVSLLDSQSTKLIT